MANVNVNRNVADPFYRYKMPRLIAKVEGKGNGIKTVIVNMPEIAKALTRPPSYPTKFFGCELGAQTQFDAKNDRYIVNGEHDCNKLQEVLDGFIKKFVLCGGCENPETTICVRGKRDNITSHCKACGYTGTVDPKHKLTTFIQKNPPTNPEEGLPENITVAAEKKVKPAKGKGDSSPTEENDGEVGMGDFDVNVEGQENGNSGSDDFEDDWPEAEQLSADEGEMQGRMAQLLMHSDLEKSIDERLDMFYGYVIKHKSVGSLESKGVLSEAERLDIGAKAALLLVRALLDPNTIVQDIHKYKPVLLRVCMQNEKAQKYLLGGMEQLIVDKANREDLLPKTPHILKALYDEDIVEEETILDWGKKASKKYVSKEDSKLMHTKAEPFLAWLRDAESESEDSDEDGLQVSFDDRGTGQVENLSAPKINGVVAQKKEELVDDLDIDDI